MTFDEERGIVLDELPMLLYNSNLEGSYILNKSANGGHYVKSMENSEEIRKLKSQSKRVIE